MAASGESLLLRAGLVSPEQLEEAHAIRRRDGGTLGECLTRMGVITEDVLLDFYHTRLLVPRVSTEELAQVDAEALAAIPADMASEFLVFPARLDEDRTLTLAMADPADSHVVEEVAFFSGRFCKRAVAAASAIRSAIERHYGVRVRPGRPVERKPPAGTLARLLPRGNQPPPPESATEPVPLTRVKTRMLSPEKGEKPRARTLTGQGPVEPEPKPRRSTWPRGRETVVDSPRARAEEPTEGPRARTATGPSPARTVVEPPLARTVVEPPLARPPAEPPPDEEAPIPLTQPVSQSGRRRNTLVGASGPAPPPLPVEALQRAVTRAEVAAHLLAFGAQIAVRSALLVMRKGSLVGFEGRGAELRQEALRKVAIPLDGPSLLRDVVQSRLPYRGSLADPLARRLLAEAFGVPPGDDVLLLPVSVAGRVICLLYAERVMAALPEASLDLLAREAGLAYERLLRARKED